MDLEESTPPTEVAMYDNGHLPSRGCSLLFKGWVLVYDPQNDHAKWVQFRGSASDLSDAEMASTEELLVYIPSEAVRAIARLDRLTEKRMETSPTNVTCANPIDTSDREESMLEEDPELAGDLCRYTGGGGHQRFQPRCCLAPYRRGTQRAYTSHLQSD